MPMVPCLISDIRRGRLIYRIAGFERVLERAPHRGSPLPAGLKASDHPKRVVVADWEKAEPDWQAGTVAGRKMKDGSRSRHAIEAHWPDVERWVEWVGIPVPVEGHGTKPVPKSKGGRPPTHNWERFLRRLAWLIVEPKFEVEPEKKFRPVVMKRMVDWCAAKYGDAAPGDEAIRKQIALFYKGKSDTD